jgi:hypothetical protein
MRPHFALKSMEQSTGHAPLAVLGYYWRQKGCFDPLERVQPPLKTVFHTPPEKLLDVVVNILAGYESLSAGSHHLRADLALAKAWGREQFADHSGISRTLAALDSEEVLWLHRAVTSIYHRIGDAHRHTLATEPLWLDLDLSFLPAGRRAEGSRKGYGSGKKTDADANWCESGPRLIVRLCSLCSTLATTPASKH